MINVHGRQVLYLLLGDVEPDAVVDARHRADRDRDFPAAPQVSLLEKDVGHVAGARVGDKPLQQRPFAARAPPLGSERAVELGALGGTQPPTF